jgi:hypothetical protein
MSYVYHHVPENMTGTILHPMNQLKSVDEKLYNLYRAGYDGREHLLKRQVPYLGCLWNDVLHCCPVHPQKIYDALNNAGVKNIPKLEYFEIDTESDINMNDAVVFYRNSEKFGDIRFEKATEVDWGNVDVIPQLTLNYYKEVAETGEPLFVYQGIPHLLYRGTIETKNLKRVTIN